MPLSNLYFASDGHPGLGVLDIFEATRRDGKTEILNLGVPINSEYDDFALIFRDQKTGYFTSNRPGGKGDDDIYEFEDKTPETKIVNYFLAIKVVGVDPTDSTQTEVPLSDAKIQFFEGSKLHRNKKLNDFATNNNGYVSAFPIELHKNFLLVVDAGDDYLKKDEEYNTYGVAIDPKDLVKYETDTTLEAKVVMTKIVVNKPEDFGYEIEINFDFDKYDIRPDAAIELDKFSVFLKENPQIDIELGSHTDAVGTEVKNQILSQNRARATFEYLVSKGINPERMTYKGYGETKLKENIQGPSEINRRTEFKITRVNKDRK